MARAVTAPARPSRGRLFAYLLVAHLAGLVVTALYASVGTTAGFGSGIDVVIGIGWVLSMPWLAVLMLIVGRWSGWLCRHMLTFCLAGPLVVSGTSYLATGRAGLVAVAMTATVASIAFFAIASATGVRRPIPMLDMPSA